MKTIILGTLLTLLLVGCSKQEATGGGEATPPEASAEAAAPAEQPPAEQAAAPVAPPVEIPPAEVISDADVLRDLQGIPASLQNQDYDTAVDTLGALALVPKTEAQQQAYAQQLRAAMQYLQEKAAADAKAQAAYQRLGRASMGR